MEEREVYGWSEMLELYTSTIQKAGVCECGVKIVRNNRYKQQLLLHVQQCGEAHYASMRQAMRTQDADYTYSVTRLPHTRWGYVNDWIDHAKATYNYYELGKGSTPVAPRQIHQLRGNQKSDTIGDMEMKSASDDKEVVSVSSGSSKDDKGIDSDIGDMSISDVKDMSQPGGNEKQSGNDAALGFDFHQQGQHLLTVVQSGGASGSQPSVAPTQARWENEYSHEELLQVRSGAGGGAQFNTVKKNLYESAFKVQDMYDESSPGRVVTGMSAIQFVGELMEWKIHANASDKAMDMILKVITSTLCTFTHYLPTSWYQVKQVAQFQSQSMYRYERCICLKKLYNPYSDSLKKYTWQSRAKLIHDFNLDPIMDKQSIQQLEQQLVCSRCYQPRFKTNLFKEVVATTIPYYYFGIENSIRELFAQRKWAEQFNLGLDMPYFSSPAHQLLLEKLAKLHIEEKECVFIEIGHDGFRPWKVAQHRSTDGVWMRVKNSSPQIFFRYMNVTELALWPDARRARADGVVESLDVFHSFKQVMRELKELYQRKMSVYNAHLLCEQEYYVILVGMYGDSPAAAKTCQTGSATATFPCPRCVIQGQPVQGPHKKTKYPAGYKDKVTLDTYPLLNEHVPWKKGVDPGKIRFQRKVYVGEDRIKLTEEQQQERMAITSENGLGDAYNQKHYGIKGKDVASQYLPYVSFNTLYVAPTFHMLLHGVVKSHWVKAVKPSQGILSASDVQKMQNRASGPIRTSDMGNRYQCVVNHGKTYTMADWLLWVDCFSPLILMGIKMQGQIPNSHSLSYRNPPSGYVYPKNFTEVVLRMHKAVDFFIRPQVLDDEEDSDSDEGVEAAQTAVSNYDECWAHFDMLVYAISLEMTKGPGPWTTSNLHKAVCWLLDQYRVRGQTGYESEIFIERSVQVCKRLLGEAVPNNPEQLMASRLLFDKSLMRMTEGRPGIISLTDALPTLFRERKETHYIGQHSGETCTLYLCGEAVGWNKIAARHRLPGVSAWAALKQMLLDPIDSFGNVLQAYEHLALEKGQVFVYPRAELSGSRIVHCEYLSKADTSESFWVLINFDVPSTGRKNVPTIARVQYYFTLRNEVDESGQRGKFYAVVRLYESSIEPQVGPMLKKIYKVKHGVYDRHMTAGELVVEPVRVCPINRTIFPRVKRNSMSFLPGEKKEAFYTRFCATANFPWASILGLSVVGLPDATHQVTDYQKERIPSWTQVFEALASMHAILSQSECTVDAMMAMRVAGIANVRKEGPDYVVQIYTFKPKHVVEEQVQKATLIAEGFITLSEEQQTRMESVALDIATSSNSKWKGVFTRYNQVSVIVALMYSFLPWTMPDDVGEIWTYIDSLQWNQDKAGIWHCTKVCIRPEVVDKKFWSWLPILQPAGTRDARYISMAIGYILQLKRTRVIKDEIIAYFRQWCAENAPRHEPIGGPNWCINELPAYALWQRASTVATEEVCRNKQGLWSVPDGQAPKKGVIAAAEMRLEKAVSYFYNVAEGVLPAYGLDSEEGMDPKYDAVYEYIEYYEKLQAKQKIKNRANQHKSPPSTNQNPSKAGSHYVSGAGKGAKLVQNGQQAEEELLEEEAQEVQSPNPPRVSGIGGRSGHVGGRGAGRVVHGGRAVGRHSRGGDGGTLQGADEAPMRGGNASRGRGRHEAQARGRYIHGRGRGVEGRGGGSKGLALDAQAVGVPAEASPGKNPECLMERLQDSYPCDDGVQRGQGVDGAGGDELPCRDDAVQAYGEEDQENVGDEGGEIGGLGALLVDAKQKAQEATAAGQAGERGTHQKQAGGVVPTRAKRGDRSERHVCLNSRGQASSGIPPTNSTEVARRDRKKLQKKALQVAGKGKGPAPGKGAGGRKGKQAASIAKHQASKRLKEGGQEATPPRRAKRSRNAPSKFDDYDVDGEEGEYGEAHLGEEDDDTGEDAGEDAGEDDEMHVPVPDS